MKAINPSNGEVLRDYPETAATEIPSILAKAQQAFLVWRRTDFSERAPRLRAAAAILRENRETYAHLMALEMGKPLAQGKSEVEKCAWVCEFFAAEASRFLTPEIISSDFPKSFVSFQPLGLVLGVMPWNFPFWQVFRAAAPALMAGNGFVLKHASNVPGCALAIEEVFKKAGFPDGLFRTLLVSSATVPNLIEHPYIQGVTVTGSSGAGSAVAAKAGALLKKTVLELGGSDPYVILQDAELEPAVETCVTARLINSGQSCIAAKRFIVVEQVAKDFQALFLERMRARKTGDPMEEGVMIGPLARVDLRETLHEQVERSVAQGAKLLLGGKIPSGPGAYYPPTVLSGVKKGMAGFDEETFGPVAAIVTATDEAEAIRLANESPFGLGAALFTRDRKRGERLAAEQLEAGCCFVNDYVRSDPRLPFGGIKQSGYGRELSAFGIREFVNIKTVCVK